MFRRALIVLLICLPGTLWADDKLVRLYAPETLSDSGLFKHILPPELLSTPWGDIFHYATYYYHASYVTAIFTNFSPTN